MQIAFKSKAVIKILCAMVLFFLFAHVATLFVSYSLEDHPEGLRAVQKLFDLDRENNIPSLFSTFLLFYSSVLLALMGRAARSRGEGRRGWWGLSLLFLFLAVDENCEIHEKFQPIMRNLFGETFFYNFEWVIVYLPLVAIIAIASRKFILALPRRSKLLFLASAFTFLLGAVVVEGIGTHYYNLHGEGVGYRLFVALEETLEMTGAVIFVHALQDRVISSVGTITLNLTGR